MPKEIISQVCDALASVLIKGKMLVGSSGWKCTDIKKKEAI